MHALLLLVVMPLCWLQGQPPVEPAPPAVAPTPVAQPAGPDLGTEDEAIVARYRDVELTFQLFGDLDAGWQHPAHEGGSETSFFAGALDLMVSGRLGEHFQVLSESVVEGGMDGEFGVDQERLWIAWRWADPLVMKLGVEHSAMSRWNRLYHHGKWLFVSTDAPMLARFEDHGGILPVHGAGLELSGQVELGGAGRLDYDAAVTNGRGPTTTDRQLVRDINDGKAIFGGLGFAPSALSGLRVGGHFRGDEIPAAPGDPLRASSLRELIATGSLELSVAGFGFIGEAALLHHRDDRTGAGYRTASGYAQASFRSGMWQPYARFDMRDVDAGDAYFAAAGLSGRRIEGVFGLRVDLHDSVALKLEGMAGRHEAPAEKHTLGAATLQLAWGL